MFDTHIRDMLEKRGVRVLEATLETIRMECTQCHSRWTAQADRVVEPSDQNRYWLCPSRCNREREPG